MAFIKSHAVLVFHLLFVTVLDYPSDSDLWQCQGDTDYPSDCPRLQLGRDQGKNMCPYYKKTVCTSLWSCSSFEPLTMTKCIKDKQGYY